MNLEIKEQIAVVTGAGSGIGKDIALTLSEEGAKVAVWDKDSERAAAVVALILEKGGTALAIQGSVSSERDVENAFKTVERELGDVHILVNNAGFGDDAALTDMSLDQWNRVIDVCLTGPFLCIRAVTPMMIRNRYGRIINIGSRARFGMRTKANYCAAKAGLSGLTRAVAIELGEFGITANIVHPGLIRTERVLKQAIYSELNELAHRTQMIKHEGNPSDITNAVMFFASVKSGFITGDEVFATGGRYG